MHLNGKYVPELMCSNRIEHVLYEYLDLLDTLNEFWISISNL